MLELYTWIVTLASIIGAYLNAKGKVSGFYFWLPANISWAIIDIKHHVWAQAVLFAYYAVICVIGIYTWRKKGIK